MFSFVPKIILTTFSDTDNVFRSLEQQLVIRRLQILEAQRSTVAVDAEFDTPVKSKNEYDSSDEENKHMVENGKAEEAKKVKLKKPKVSISDAAAKIDADDLSTFLINISVRMIFVLISREGEQQCRSP
nr:hypothetical protein CFP56_33025 [Quercus suber]